MALAGWQGGTVGNTATLQLIICVGLLKRILSEKKTSENSSKTEHFVNVQILGN